jgi:hypothetical protein
MPLRDRVGRETELSAILLPDRRGVGSCKDSRHQHGVSREAGGTPELLLVPSVLRNLYQRSSRLEARRRHRIRPHALVGRLPAPPKAIWARVWRSYARSSSRSARTRRRRWLARTRPMSRESRTSTRSGPRRVVEPSQSHTRTNRSTIRHQNPSDL